MFKLHTPCAPHAHICGTTNAWYVHLPVNLRIKLFRTKMNLIPQKDKVKLDAWTCKSLLSFVKMKTRKHLGSKVSWLYHLYLLLLLACLSANLLLPNMHGMVIALCMLSWAPPVCRVVHCYPWELGLLEDAAHPWSEHQGPSRAIAFHALELFVVSFWYKFIVKKACHLDYIDVYKHWVYLGRSMKRHVKI